MTENYVKGLDRLVDYTILKIISLAQYLFGLMKLNRALKIASSVQCPVQYPFRLNITEDFSGCPILTTCQ